MKNLRLKLDFWHFVRKLVTENGIKLELAILEESAPNKNDTVPDSKVFQIGDGIDS